jgi:hypothetical protein
MNAIFDNAMIFNLPQSIYHQEAERMKNLAAELTSSFSDSAKIVEPEEANASEPNMSATAFKKACIRVIDEYKALDTNGIFYEPVPSIVPNYYYTIDRALDFATLRRKLNANKIKNIDDFKSNLKLIFENCMKFNDETTVYHQLAKQFMDKLDSKIETIRNPDTAKTATPKTSKKSTKPPKTPTATATTTTDTTTATTPTTTTTTRRTSTSRRAAEPVTVAPPQEEESISEIVDETPEVAVSTPSPASKKSSTATTSSTSKKKYSRKDRPTPAAELQFPKMDAPVMSDLQIAFLNKMRLADYYQIFHLPVEGVPGYTDLIEKPMDFSTMETKVKNNDYNGEWRLFEDDMDLIFANCKKFNAPNSVYSRESNRLLRLFRKWKKDMYLHYQVNLIDNTTVLDVFDKIAQVKPKKLEQLPPLDSYDEDENAHLEDQNGSSTNSSSSSSSASATTEASTSRKSSKSSGAPRPMSEIIAELNEALISQDKHKLFLHPLPNVPTSNAYTPMDFTTMKNKKYKRLGLFEEDFKLLCDNAMHYNKPDTLIFKEAQRLLKFGEERIKEIRSRVVKKDDDKSTTTTTTTTTTTSSSSSTSKKSTRKERASNRKNKKAPSLQQAVEMHTKQVEDLRTLVKANATLYRMQKRETIPTVKDYCAFSELSYIPQEVSNPPANIDPGDFPTYSYTGTGLSAAVRSTMLFDPAVVQSGFSSTGPMTPIIGGGIGHQPILQQLYQMDSMSVATPATSPFSSSQARQAYSYSHPHQVVSYKPVRVTPKTSIVVKSFTENVPSISKSEYEQFGNMSVDECLKSYSSGYQSLVYKEMKRDQQPSDDNIVDLLLNRRRKVEQSSNLLTLLQQGQQTTNTTNRDQILNDVIDFIRTAEEEEQDVEMTESEKSLIQDLTQNIQDENDDDADAADEQSMKDLWSQVTQIMQQEGVTL